MRELLASLAVATGCEPDQVWESDYNPNLLTCTWSETINADGTVQGRAIHPGD
jgi:hypothetical protein